MGKDIKAFFNDLNKDTMHLVDEFYDKDVSFVDPMGSISGAAELKEYYARLYQNVQQIEFQFSEVVTEGDTSVGLWKMILTAESFNGGKPVTVDGNSVIKFGGSEGKAIYHRDYFDMGEFVYENVPVVRGIVRFVKKKMKEQH